MAGSGSLISSPTFGPYPGWRATALAVGPNDESHLLWTNVNGNISFWNIHTDNATYSVLPSSPAPGLVSGTGATMGYDGDGLRAWKQNSAGVRTYFVYDGSDPTFELDSSGSVLAVNTFGANGLASRHATSTGATTFYAFDERGNVYERLDSNGNPISADLYDAFGNRTSTAPVSDTWGFGAQEGYQTDAETGLLLLTNRYYDPQAGRLLTRDSMGYAGGINLYGYVGNDPGNVVDPNGTQGYGTNQYPLLPSPYDATNDNPALEYSRTGEIHDGPSTVAILSGRVHNPSESTRKAGTIRNINPKEAEKAGRVHNCVNCAIATDHTLSGHQACAMPGELTDILELENIYGGQFEEVNFCQRNRGIATWHRVRLERNCVWLSQGE